MYSLYHDRQLVKLLQQKDPAAFKEVSSRYYDNLYTRALLLAEHPGKAEAIVKRVFEQAYNKIHEYHGESMLLTWLYNMLADCIKCEKEPSPAPENE